MAGSEGQTPFAHSNILFKSALNVTMGHICKLNQLVPKPHFAFLARNELMSPLEVGHGDTMVALFEDPTFAEFLFSFVATFEALLNCSNWKQSDRVLRVAVLYAEAGQWAADTKSIEYVEDVLVILGSFVANDALFQLLAKDDNATFLYSIVAATHSLTRLSE